MAIDVRRAVIVGTFVLAFSAGTAVLALRSSDGEHQPPESGNGLLLDRPEVRLPVCSGVAGWEWHQNQWWMTSKPVTIFFAGEVVGSNHEVAAQPGKGGSLVQKIPMRIEAAPGTALEIAGKNRVTGGVMTWEGASAMPTVSRPVAEQYFLPGAMRFDDAGCYDVFVTVDGTRFCPFSFEVVASRQPGL